MKTRILDFKDSKIPWIGRIPKHWGISKIKYCLKENFSGCWGNDLENEQISQNSRLCIRVADFDFDRQKIKQTADTFRNYTKSQISSLKLKDGDLIIEKSGGGDKMPVGRSVIFEQDLFGNKEVLFANFCQCFRPFNINNKFFAHAMKAFYQNNNMRFFFNQTTGIQNLSIFNIINAFLPYPPIDEQEKIVEFLDKKCEIIERRLENLEQKIQSLKEYKKSLISECVTKGLKSRILEFRDSGIAWIGRIPKHWEILKGKYLFTNPKKPVFENDEVITCFRDGEVTLRSKRREDGFTISLKEIGYQGIDAGDLVIHGMDGFAGAIGISQYRGKCSPVLNILETKNSKKFYMYLLRNMAYTGVFEALSTGIRVRTCDTNWAKIRNIVYLVPPLDEQKEIAEFLDKKCEKIDKINENYTRQIQSLKEYKKSLIYECVTGKKEIKIC